MIEVGFQFTFALLQNVFPLYHTALVEVVSVPFLTVFLKTLFFCDTEKLLEKEHIEQ